MLKADDATLRSVRASVLKSSARGWDPARALDELGLVLYPAKGRGIAADTLRQAADMLTETPVDQLPAGRMVRTPLDTRNAIIEWLRLQADQLEKTNVAQA